jgi:hypothetical protein
MSKKISRKQKLEMLKTLKKSQDQSRKLADEQSINILQTKLLEKELNEMKAHLETLEQKRNALQDKINTQEQP